MTKEVYYSLLSERLETYRIDKQLELINRFKIWGYFLLPLILWLKYTFVTLLLQLPLIIKFIEIPFKRIFRVVMLASVTIIIMSVVRISWLFSIPPDHINADILKIVPLSINSFINTSEYPQSAIAVFSNINLFELGWLILVYSGLVSVSEDKLKKTDAVILVASVWSFLILLQYAVMTYIENTFS